MQRRATFVTVAARVCTIPAGIAALAALLRNVIVRKPSCFEGSSVTQQEVQDERVVKTLFVVASMVPFPWIARRPLSPEAAAEAQR